MSSSHRSPRPRRVTPSGLAITATTCALLTGTAGAASPSGAVHDRVRDTGHVYVETNASGGNQILDYVRDARGRLRELGAVNTGGYGTGHIRLSSQSPIVLSADKRFLLVANVGSNDVTVLRIRPNGLQLVEVALSGGTAPYSIAVQNGLVYVLNNGLNGLGNVTGFRLSGSGHLSYLRGSSRPLSGDHADPAQVGFSPNGRTLLVTEKATNLIDSWTVGHGGLLGERTSSPSSGQTPFGFAFTDAGVPIITEAVGGQIGKATLSSYSIDGANQLHPISGSVPDGQSEVCWAVLSNDGKFAYITNFGSSNISSYHVGADGTLTLAHSIAANDGHSGIGDRDESITPDGKYLYAIDIITQKIHGWAVRSDGTLKPVGQFPGLPLTVAGLVTS